MKSIFLCVAVCAIALNLSWDFVNPAAVKTQGYNPANFGSVLRQQYDKRAKQIIDAWRQCNETYNVAFHEGIDIFQNPPWSDERTDPDRMVKCLVDCTLRRTGVVVDCGLDDAEYMRQIRELRFNYTTFSMNDQSLANKQQIWASMESGANSMTPECYAVFSSDSFFSQPMYRIPTLSYKDRCYKLIQSYSKAARNCKDVKDPDGDDCETSWKIMRCIMTENRGRFYNSPFYPVKLRELQ